MDDTTDPDPVVPERARGPRRFPAAYKARILALYDTLGKAEKGALLRREGLYWTYYCLYPVIDIYSRYVPGWMLARAERASLAEALLAETI
jgi:transposase InsO family protein